MKELKDPARIQTIREEVERRIRDDHGQGLLLAPPDIVSWAGIVRFEYQVGRANTEVEVPSIDSFCEFLADEELLAGIDYSGLQERARVHAVNDAGERIRSWSAWDCLSGQLVSNATTYVLDDGAILEVAYDYLNALNGFIDAIPASPIPFPHTELGTHEDVYNQLISVRSLPH